MLLWSAGRQKANASLLGRVAKHGVSTSGGRAREGHQGTWLCTTQFLGNSCQLMHGWECCSRACWGCKFHSMGVLAAYNPCAACALPLLLFHAFTWVYVQARSGFFWQSAAKRLVMREQKQESFCVQFYSQHNAPFLPVSMFAFPLCQQRLQHKNLPGKSIFQAEQKFICSRFQAC